MQNVKRIIWFIAVVFAWPLVVCVEGLRAKQRLWYKKLLVLLVSFCLLIGWLGGLVNVAYGVYLLIPAKAKPDKEVTVRTQGPSMLPTLQLEDSVLEHNPNSKPINRGDLASFSNPETQGLRYIKRVIGLPGETVLIRDGRVLIDGKPLNEPYVYHHDRTYGNTFATECEEYKIPENSYFLMGDNRGVSWDSRAVGYVHFDELNGVVYREDGPTFDGEAALSDRKTFSASKMVELLNSSRRKKDIKSVFLSKNLTTLAQKRADAIAQDLNAWKKEGKSIDSFLSQEKYRYNLAYEYVTFGYLDESQLLQQAEEVPIDSDNFYSESFTEAGVGVANITKGECSYPLVVTLLSWPSEPSYSDETVAYWKRENSILKETLSDLQSWVGYGEKDQRLLQEAIALNAQMVEITQRVFGKMSRKEWLSDRDQDDIAAYQSKVNLHNKHLNQLFPDVQGMQTEYEFPVYW